MTGVAHVVGHKANSHRFDSRSGHTPGLQVRSLVGLLQEATKVSLPLFLPPFPSKNK